MLDRFLQNPQVKGEYNWNILGAATIDTPRTHTHIHTHTYTRTGRILPQHEAAKQNINNPKMAAKASDKAKSSPKKTKKMPAAEQRSVAVCFQIGSANKRKFAWKSSMQKMFGKQQTQSVV